MSAALPQTTQRTFSWAAFLLGFAFGGFFDGILLHQILQWHHLLLGIQAGPLADMRVQLLADGLFHALMYLIALGSVLSLWRSRSVSATLPAAALLASALLGFGAWHVVDAVLSHWVLGIHRIKMDSPYPLAWDVAWLVTFGFSALLAGLWLKRRHVPDRRPASGSARTGLIVLVLAAALLAAIPPQRGEQVAVLVQPNRASELLAGLASVKGGIVWAHRSGALWVIRLGDASDASLLYRHGAILVTRSPAALGCLAWTR